MCSSQQKIPKVRNVLLLAKLLVIIEKKPPHLWLGSLFFWFFIIKNNGCFLSIAPFSSLHPGLTTTTTKTQILKKSQKNKNLKKSTTGGQPANGQYILCPKQPKTCLRADLAIQYPVEYPELVFLGPKQIEMQLMALR